MKILVTGGAGFIGANFINYWLSKYKDDSVVNLDKLTYAANPLSVDSHKKSFTNYSFVQGDICDKDLVDDLVKSVDLVVHFAAESHVDRSIENSDVFIKTNILGTHNLLEAARRNGNVRFHHISTDEVFGTLELGSSDKFSELTPYSPRSPYSASKASADHLVRAYFETYKLPVTITNCSNNYGPYQFPEKVIPLYITRLMRNLPIPVYGTGQAIRDYLYVTDHCSAIESVIKKGRLGESYCIGGNAERNTLDVVDAILKALGKEDRRDLVVFTKDRTGHDMRYAIDFSKLNSELGWAPTVSFEEGISKTVEWYKSNEDWYLPLFEKAQEICEKYLS